MGALPVKGRWTLNLAAWNWHRGNRWILQEEEIDRCTMRGKSPQTWGHERRSRRDEWILNLGSKGNGITLKTCAFVPSKHCAIFVQHGLVMKNIELIFTSSFNWTRSFSGSFHFLCRTVVCWRLFCCGLSSSSIYENVIRRKREYYNCSLKIKWLYVCSDFMVYSWNPDWNNPIQTLFFFFANQNLE